MKEFLMQILVAVLTVLACAVVWAAIYVLLAVVFPDSVDDWGTLLLQAGISGLLWSAVWYMLYLLYSRKIKRKQNKIEK